MSGLGLPRRAFLGGLGLSGAGLALGAWPVPARAAGSDPNDVLPEGGLRPNVFLHVAPDGLVSIVCHRSEMGQGVRSSLPVLIADELGADMARVRVIQATGDKRFGNQNTDGSSSVRGHYDELRRLGASARVMLIAAAARRLGVPPTACSAREHRVVHDASGRSLPFAELVAAARVLPVPDPAHVSLRPRAELAHARAPIPLLDGLEIVTGRAEYGADVKRPGMLYAVVLHPPVAGGRLVRYDAARALAIPGVRAVVELPAPRGSFGFQSLGGLGVVAEHTWAALRGRRALEVSWDGGEHAGYDSLEFREQLLMAVRQPGKVVRKTGDVTRALDGAARRVEAEYTVPHLAHAPMEPPVALAEVSAERAEIWTSTQNPQSCRSEVAKALELDPDRVTVHVTLLGGGFGRKSQPDYAVEAALLSRRMQAPVRLQWTREDDIQHDYYHTCSAQRLVAGLVGSGKVSSWLHRTAFPSIGSTFDSSASYARDGELGQGVLDTPLSIPNVQAENGAAHAEVRIGWFRSVNNIHHAFAISSFIDEIAHARGADPKDVVLELIGPPRHVSAEELGVDKVPNYGASLAEHPIDTGRMRRVVERVCELSGWARRSSDGRGFGLAVHRSFLSAVGVVAAVSRGDSGRIRVDEVWVVADAGTLVNPERVRAQFEGAVLFAMSFTLFGAITMRGGAVQQSNFHDYRLARIGDAPRAIHVELVDSGERSGGVGEPGVPPVAPAIANAVFALTGIRVRDLPMSRSGLA